MNQDHALNWNAGAAPPTTIGFTAPPTGAAPTVISCAHLVNPGAAAIVWQNTINPQPSCRCPSCGKAH